MSWASGHKVSLVLYPDPVLRTVCRAVERFDTALRDLADEMLLLMRASSGIGLAAPQVGFTQRLIVCGIEDRFFVLTNPEVTRGTSPKTYPEGCLSLPGVSVDVSRAERIRVRGCDVNGDRRTFSATGLWARVIQHEIDHLNGILICDHASPEVQWHPDRSRGLPLMLVEERAGESRRKGSNQRS
jgi:peptide deformylase